jgi:hypothetical protein
MDTNPEIPQSVLPITHPELHQHAHAHSLSQQSLERCLTLRGTVELYGWKIRWPSYTNTRSIIPYFLLAFCFDMGALPYFLLASYTNQSIYLDVLAGFEFQF